MSKKHFSGIIRNVRSSMKKHSPEILTGVGIAGMVTTTVMAVRATPKALMLIEEKKDEYETDTLSPVETVKAAWTCYIPSAIVGGVSIFCLIGASSVNLRRNAALATAYTLSESALKEYQEKVVETIGEKKERDIRDSIAKDKVEQNPVVQKEIIITEKGDTLCFDTLSGRYFKSNRDQINKAVNELNRRMRDDMFISLNEFYYEIGMDGTKLGDVLGWNIDRGYIDIDYSSHLANGETPCLVLDYRIVPEYDYQ